MAILDDLAAQVAASTGVEASAIDLINGIAARIQAAVDEALAGGATAAQLAPVQDEVTAMKASADALSAAIVANTPGAPASAAQRAKAVRNK
jgi:hypothetical protein